MYNFSRSLEFTVERIMGKEPSQPSLALIYKFYLQHSFRFWIDFFIFFFLQSYCLNVLRFYFMFHRYWLYPIRN